MPGYLMVATVMELIMLNKDPVGESGRFFDIADDREHVTGSLLFRTAEGLKSHLRTYSEDRRVVVIIGADLELLRDLKLEEEILQGVHLVLVLADHEENTLGAGHRLHPRYLTFMDGNWEILAKVLDKIIG